MFDDYFDDYFYEIYVSKNPAEDILRKIKLFSMYDISKAKSSKRVVTYYDSPTNNLTLANLLLSTDVIDGKGELTLEKNLDNEENAKYVRLLQTYKHSTDFNANQTIYDFIPFLRESIRSFFNMPLDIDTDNIFKRARPIYVFEIKNEAYKVVSFGGFKCWITIEYTTYKNILNGRENYVTYVKVSQAEDSKKNDMDEFIKKLEKYCKCINRINKSKLSECIRLTRDIPEIINKKKKNKNKKSFELEDEIN